MKSKIKTLNPDQLLESYMDFGAKRNKIFKQDYALFYIAKLEDISKISKPPIPPVKAKTHTLFFLKKGIIHMKVGSRTVRIQDNEFIIIPAGQVFSHSDEDIEETQQGEGYMCGFNDDFLIGQIGSSDLLKTFEFLSLWGNPILKPEVRMVPYLSHVLDRIFLEFTEHNLEHKTIIQSYLIALLCDLNKNYKPLSDHKNKAAVELTNQFKELLHQNITAKHKVSEFAEMLNISPNHLNKTIKLITKKSPSIWIRETIINEAKVLLFQSDLSIQEISSALGIEDQSYFSRLFKKQEGITPVSYRQMIDLS